MAVNAWRLFRTRDLCNSPLLHGTTVPWLMGICLVVPLLLPINVPIILLTENLRCLTGRPRESIRSRSKALYKLGVFSATETSQNPIACDAASEAPSCSDTWKKS